MFVECFANVEYFIAYTIGEQQNIGNVYYSNANPYSIGLAQPVTHQAGGGHVLVSGPVQLPYVTSPSYTIHQPYYTPIYTQPQVLTSLPAINPRDSRSRDSGLHTVSTHGHYPLACSHGHGINQRASSGNPLPTVAVAPPSTPPAHLHHTISAPALTTTVAHDDAPARRRSQTIATESPPRAIAARPQHSQHAPTQPVAAVASAPAAGPRLQRSSSSGTFPPCISTL